MSVCEPGCAYSAGGAREHPSSATNSLVAFELGQPSSGSIAAGFVNPLLGSTRILGNTRILGGRNHSGQLLLSLLFNSDLIRHVV